jgi:dihydropteroate synthase
MKLLHARGELELDRCLVMGVVNRTPDSFYDPGRMDLEDALDHAARLVEEGADLLDVGGVKAGPGEDVSESEEMSRVVPLIETLAGRTKALLSVDTARASVATAAVAAGAAIVNDVTGLTDEAMAEVCGASGAGLVIMHNGGQVRGRPRHPRYRDVVAAVIAQWDRCARLAEAAGVSPQSLVVDPGLDFGKTTHHSLELMNRLDELVGAGRPVLVAPSRKDVVGETLALPPEQRLEGTLALVALAVHARAAMVRVHDVQAAARTVRMVEAVTGRSAPSAPLRGLWE